MTRPDWIVRSACSSPRARTIFTENRVSLPELRCELRSNVRVKHHDETDNEREKDAVLQRDAEQPAFVLAFHGGCSGSDGDARQTDHLSHHSTCRVSCSHEDRIHSKPISSYFLKSAEKRVRRSIAACQKHTEGTYYRTEQWKYGAGCRKSKTKRTGGT